MGCPRFIAAIAVASINTVVAMVCLVAVAPLVALLSQSHFLLEMACPLVERLNAYLRQVKSGVVVDVGDVGFLAEVRPLLVVALCVMLLILCVCLLGCLSTSVGSRFAVMFYIILLTQVVMLYLSLLVTLVNGRSTFRPLTDILKENIKGKYEGFFSKDPYTLMWNTLMVNARCCGVDGPEDFEHARRWKGERNLTLHNSGAVIALNASTPLACCPCRAFRAAERALKEFPPPTTASYISNHSVIASLRCDDGDEKKDGMRGCYQVVWDAVEPYFKTRSFIIFNAMLVTLLAASWMTSSCILRSDLKLHPTMSRSLEIAPSLELPEPRWSPKSV